MDAVDTTTACSKRKLVPLLPNTLKKKKLVNTSTSVNSINDLPTNSNLIPDVAADINSILNDGGSSANTATTNASSPIRKSKKSFTVAKKNISSNDEISSSRSSSESSTQLDHASIHSTLTTLTNLSNLLSIPPSTSIPIPSIPSIPILSNTGLDSQIKPKHLKSCLRCRKHKTKCDFTNSMNPNSCSSCFKKGLVCELVTVIPIKRSNIIKNIRLNIQSLQVIINNMIINNNYLINICIQKGLNIDGLVNITQLNKFTQRKNSLIQNSNDMYEENEDEDENYVDNNRHSIQVNMDTNYTYNDIKYNLQDQKHNIETSPTTTSSPINITTPDYSTSSGSAAYVKPVHNGYYGNNNAETNSATIDSFTFPMDYSAANTITTDSKGNSHIHAASLTPPISDESDSDADHLTMATSVNDHITNADNEIDYDVTQTEFKFHQNQLSYSLTSEQAQLNLVNFNKNFLNYCPIINTFQSVHELYHYSNLLFWSIMYITSNDLLIWNNYLKLQLIQSCLLKTPNSIKIIQSILLIANFNINNSFSSLDNSLIFKLLTLSKDICLQLGINRGNQFLFEFSRRIDTIHFNQHLRGKIWSMLYILGNQYSFKLGLPWSQKVDWFINQTLDNLSISDTDYEFGKLLEISKMNYNLIEQLGKSFKSLNGIINNDSILINSIYIWERRISSYQDLHLDISKFNKLLIYQTELNLFTLLLTSFSSTDEESEQIVFEYVNKSITKAIQIINESQDLISENQTTHSNNDNLPNFIKSMISFSCFLLLRLYYSPYIITYPSLGSLSGEVIKAFELLLTLNQSSTCNKDDIQLIIKYDEYFKLKPEFFYRSNSVIQNNSYLCQGYFYDMSSLISQFERNPQRDDFDMDEENSIDEYFQSMFTSIPNFISHGNKDYQTLLQRLSNGENLNLFKIYQEKQGTGCHLSFESQLQITKDPIVSSSSLDFNLNELTNLNEIDDVEVKV